MLVAFEGKLYKITFVHHNPARPYAPKPEDAVKPQFTGTACTLTYMQKNELEELTPVMNVAAVAHLHDHPVYQHKNDVPMFVRRYEPFNKKFGRMISLRRAAKLMFGKDKAEAFVQAYLSERWRVDDDGDQIELGY